MNFFKIGRRNVSIKKEEIKIMIFLNDDEISHLKIEKFKSHILKK